MDDLISRQAVLDKLNRLIEVERLQGTDEMGYGRERVSAYESMIFEIESEYLYPSVKSQEPCEDAISRRAVLDAIRKSRFLIDATEKVIKLPPVEPCEDCISRRAVMDAMYELCGEGSLKDNPWRDNPHIDSIIYAIEHLPSVTSKQTDALDKIRAEIKEQYGGCGLINDGLDIALSIIDKYLAESEGAE